MKKSVVQAAVSAAIAEAPALKGPIVTVAQLEDRNPALRGRVRGWILQADVGCAGFEGLRTCVIRVARSVMLSEGDFLAWLASHAGRPPAVARNPHGRAGKGEGRK